MLYQSLLLVLTLMLSAASAVYAEEVSLSRGEEWIRNHPFQISAFGDIAVNMEKYKDFGFTAYMPALPAGEDMPARMFGAAADVGLGWHWFYRWNPNTDNDAFLARIQEYRTRFDHNLGFVIGDENNPEQFAALSVVLDRAREIAPDALIYHAMQGKDMFPKYTHEPETYFSYLDQVANVLKPDVYMPNQYPFYRGGTASNFYEHLELVRAKALEAGVPMMNWLQGFAWTDGPFHVPSESELRLQAFVSLAYGHKGLSYWSYCSPYQPYSVCLLEHNGAISVIGAAVKEMIPEIVNLGEVMKNLTSTGVYYCPAMLYAEGQWVAVQPKGTTQWTHAHTPDIIDVKVSHGANGFILSTFVDDDNQPYLMLVNTHHGAGLSAAETTGAITVRFLYTVSKLERLDRHTGQWETMPLFQHTLLHYNLPGGTGELFRMIP